VCSSYNEDIIEYIIKNYSFAFEKYNNILEYRTSHKAITLFKKMNRSHKLNKILNG